MAQHDYNIANQSGQAFRADLNNALAAIVSGNSGASAPSTTFAYQYWVDTSSSPALLKQRNGANNAWVTIGQLDTANLQAGTGSIVNADVNASAGIVASKLSFTQAGTGATARTVDSKLKDVVSVKDFGAVGNGVADDTTAFSNAFATGKAVYAPAGTYLLNFLNVPSNTKLFGDGSATVIKPLTGEVRCALGCDSGSSSTFIENVTIRDVRFLGDVATLGFSEQKHLTSFNGAKNLLIENCDFIGFRGDGICIGSGNDGGQERHNQSVSIRNCFFDGINKDNRQGISVIDCTDLLIDGCYFTRTTRSNMPGAIDIEPDAFAFHIVRSIKITNNYFYDIGGNVGCISVYLPGITYTTAPRGFLVQGNYIDTCTSNALHFGYPVPGGITTATASMGVVWRDNVVVSAGQPFFIYGAKDSLIQGNTFTNCADAALISYSTSVSNVIGLTLANNTFRSCGSVGGNGLALFKCSSVKLLDNEFIDCGTGVPGAANAIDFNTGTSSSITIVRNRFTAPTSKTLIAIQKEAGHTFTANTNAFYGNELNGLPNNFGWGSSESGVASYPNEGTAYTPVVSGSSTAGTGTYTAQLGYYTKIGKLVSFQIEVSWSAHTGSGQIYVSLPSTINSNSVEYQPVSIASSGITLAAGQQPAALIFKTGSRVQIYGLNAGTLGALSLPSSGTLYISGSYLAST